ncbi:MAG: SPOR domain-containing protein [Rickettsiales bacterium]|nr:SPOR domain-containing protein [Rickettsiales bacterium]
MPTRVRIVDEKGKPAKINKMTIKFNEEQMARQREAVDRTQNSQNRKIPVNKFKQQDDESFIFPTTQQDDYPDELFADRITNYNYQHDSQQIEVVAAPKRQTENIKPNDKQVIIVDNKEQKKSPSTKNEKSYSQKGYYIQVGIYSEKKNAENIYKKYSDINSGKIEEYNNKGKKYKVVLGPYKDRNSAENDMNKVIKLGHYDVYITEQK